MPTIKTTEHQVYSLDEMLADEGLKKKLLEKHIDINVDYDWWEYSKSDFEAILETIGFWDIQTQFSGFWSQGDGASFSGKYSYEKGCLDKIKSYAPNDYRLISIVERIVALQKSVGYKYGCIIKTSGRNSHEYTMQTYLNSDYQTDKFYEKLCSLEDEFLDAFRDLARWWYSQLENDYSYLTSEEAVIDTLRENEYEYKSNGSIF